MLPGIDGARHLSCRLVSRITQCTSTAPVVRRPVERLSCLLTRQGMPAAGFDSLRVLKALEGSGNHAAFEGPACSLWVLRRVRWKGISPHGRYIGRGPIGQAAGMPRSRSAVWGYHPACDSFRLCAQQAAADTRGGFGGDSICATSHEALHA